MDANFGQEIGVLPQIDAEEIHGRGLTPLFERREVGLGHTEWRNSRKLEQIRADSEI